MPAGVAECKMYMYSWKLMQVPPWKFTITVLCLFYGADVDPITVGATKITDVSAGDILTFECTVLGSRSDSTVWTGTVFCACTTHEIVLLHRRFGTENGTFWTECNEGNITGQSIESYVEGNNSNNTQSFYTSQLVIFVDPEMIEKEVECIHDHNDSESIGNIRILYNESQNIIININMSTEDVASMILKETRLPIVIIISISVVIILITLLLFTPLLLYRGLRKKIWSISVCDTGEGASEEQSHCHVIEVDNYTEVVKVVDNKAMDIYNQSLSNYELKKTVNITPEEGETVISRNNLDNLVYTLRGEVSSKWHSFGLALGLPNEILSQLKDYSTEECLVEVLDYWLKNHHGNPTWQEIMDAKRNIDPQ